LPNLKKKKRPEISAVATDLMLLRVTRFNNQRQSR